MNPSPRSKLIRLAVGGCLLAAGLACAVAAPAPAPSLQSDDFTVISSATSPRVTWAVKGQGTGLTFSFEVEPWPGGTTPPKVEAGIAAAKKTAGAPQLKSQDKASGVYRYEWSVPTGSVVVKAADWEKLRFAFAVSWPGGPDGAERQRERFRHKDAHAAHAGLSPDENDWQPLDLRQHFSEIADRKNKIVIPFTQPLDGKATLVIEDAAGNRVRNLVSGQAFAKGAREIAWDGLDERGSVVSPGDYRWRAISHPGIRPEYLLSFCNDGSPPWRTGTGQDMWGPDHSTITAAVAGKDWTFFAGRVAESGYAIIAVDQAGKKQMHYMPPSGTGLAEVQLAVDGDTLFAAHDGLAWGEKIDRNKPDWKATQKLTLSRFDVATGKARDFPDKSKFVLVATLEVGPGSAEKSPERPSLAGLAALGGKVFLANRATNSIFVLDPATGDKSGEFPVPDVGALTTNGRELFAVSGTKIVRVDPASGKTSPVRCDVPFGAISGLAVDAQGRIYAVDSATNVVQVISPEGKLARTIGQPRKEAPYVGAYHADWLVNPRALAVAANGWLWITEDRWHPKRLSAWDTATWQLKKEKFGPTHYGASGGGFDEADATRWIGGNTLWQVDFAGKSATPLAILEPEAHEHPMLHHSILHVGGGTIVISFGKMTQISELESTGRLRPLAAVSACHQWSYAYDWKPPQAFIDAFNRAVPNPPKSTSGRGAYADARDLGVMWVDADGDGEMQANEFNFGTEGEGFAGGGWGIDLHDLTIRALGTVKGKRVLVTLPPTGAWSKGGLLKYAPLNSALAQAVPVDVSNNYVETSVDRFGNLFCNSQPEMKCFAPDGKLRWTYPNGWVGVHGSHDAPLPEIGVLQGALFFLGFAPLDETSDVFVMNGNHGRFFAMTSDGLYLDEFFKDVRMGNALDAYLIGGECFGGFFGRAEKDGTYYLQSGHCDYRIFRVNGFQQAVRSAGTISVSKEQAAAATKNYERGATRATAAREVAVPPLKKSPNIDGEGNDWGGGVQVAWDKSRNFPVRASVAFDDKNLYLHYDVRDDSPWLNTGKDVTMLFKTGDSVDLQLGTDPGADAKRSGPAPGDVRLLIAPFDGKATAVLYRHRLKDPAKAKPVTFTSPWRSEKVDDVQVLTDARIAAKTVDGGYRVEAAIPLASLGLGALAGQTLRADFGALYGDMAGTITQLRNYWSNQATNLVNDVPGEIMLTPNRWGVLRFESKQP